MIDWAGRVLSKVEVEQLLARGGMAELYLGRHTTLNRSVAVKVLHTHLSADQIILTRFRDEAQAVAAMRHPNIVQVYDFDIMDGRPYIVMEYVQGMSLAEYLIKRRLLRMEETLLDSSRSGRSPSTPKVSLKSNDLSQQLAFARQTLAHNRSAALDLYEILIAGKDELSHIITDLSELVSSSEGNTPPRIRRLLGDALMSQGRVKEATAVYQGGDPPDLPQVSQMPETPVEPLELEMIRGRPLDPEIAARLIEGIGTALHYAHVRGIVHRDLKPSNIMLRREAGPFDIGAPLPNDIQPVLTDFGVARLMDATAHTASGELIGTPAYMSPEQADGRHVDARSDIYALGIMLYEMLAGRPPFDPYTQKPATILLKQMTETPQPMPGVGPELQAVADRALAKDPEQRFQSALELVAVLNTTLGLPVPTEVSQQASHISVLPTDMVAPKPQTESGATDQKIKNRLTWPSLGIAALAATALILAVLGVGALLLMGLLGRGNAAEELEPVSGEASSDIAIVDSTTPHGKVLFHDATLGIFLNNLEPPPPGFVYEAWLTEPDSNPFSLGPVDAINGQVTLEFANLTGGSLTRDFSGFVLSVEPETGDDPAMSEGIAYRGQIPAETLQYLRLLDRNSGGEPLQSSLPTSLVRQADTFGAHQQLITHGISTQYLEGARQQAEQVVNCIEGREGADFADWDSNGQIENPCSDVGLLPSLMLLAEAIKAEPTMLDATPDTIEFADALGKRLTKLIASVEEAKVLAIRVAEADSIEEIESLVAEMDSSRVRIQNEAVSIAQDAQTVDLAIGAEVYEAGS